jgi:hypothetical protein
MLAGQFCPTQLGQLLPPPLYSYTSVLHSCDLKLGLFLQIIGFKMTDKSLADKELGTYWVRLEKNFAAEDTEIREG